MKLTIKILAQACTLLLLISTLLSCSGAKYTYPSLVGKGMLPLSSSNAYQGANLFLSRELEKSSYLFRFFESKGAPTAIEIQERKIGFPELYLYYAPENSVYVADLKAQGRNRQWILRGPYGIDRHHYKALREMTDSLTGTPVFDLYGKPFYFYGNEETKVATNTIEPEVPYIAPTPTPTPTPKPKKPAVKKPTLDEMEKKARKPKKKYSPFDDPKFIPRNIDQKALMLAQGYALRDTNGDILHKVRPGETLSHIVDWYTGTVDNYAVVLKKNDIDDEEPLEAGATVSVPQYLILRTKKMARGYNPDKKKKKKKKKEPKKEMMPSGYGYGF